MRDEAFTWGRTPSLHTAQPKHSSGGGMARVGLSPSRQVETPRNTYQRWSREMHVHFQAVSIHPKCFTTSHQATIAMSVSDF
jgi:hypothetical protein